MNQTATFCNRAYRLVVVKSLPRLKTSMFKWHIYHKSPQVESINLCTILPRPNCISHCLIPTPHSGKLRKLTFHLMALSFHSSMLNMLTPRTTLSWSQHFKDNFSLLPCCLHNFSGLCHSKCTSMYRMSQKNVVVACCYSRATAAFFWDTL